MVDGFMTKIGEVEKFMERVKEMIPSQDILRFCFISDQITVSRALLWRTHT